MSIRTKAERREASRPAKQSNHSDRSAKTSQRAGPKASPSSYQMKARPIEILPKNPTQAKYIDALYTDGIDIIFATGPAGTGKTYLPSLFAIREWKDAGFKKIVITRPIIPNGEDIGFLPGDLVEKMGPWVRPILDSFGKAGISTMEITSMIEKGTLEIAPLEMMRGRTFDDTIVIADEMQNATQSQMKMLLTRIGEGSRMVITGDLEQRDRADDECGLLDFTRRLARASQSKTRRFAVIEFSACDVERHPIIGDVLHLYGN